MKRNTRVMLVTAALILAIALWVACRGRHTTLVTHTVASGGLERTVHVHVPPGHSRDRPAPLVLALHGGGGKGEGFDGSTLGQVSREADRRGWVVAFPDGVAKGWNDGRPPENERARERAAVDDVAFLDALIDRLHADYGIDRARVYAMGISNGGFMSYRLALDRAERIAAIAAVAAGMPKVLAEREPARPVAVLILSGTADPLVPYEGGAIRVLGSERGEVLGAVHTAQRWAQLDGCVGLSESEDLPDADRDDGTRIHAERWRSCRDGSTVALYGIAGGGHTWPGGKQYLPKVAIGPVSRDVDGTKLIFDFFERHRR